MEGHADAEHGAAVVVVEIYPFGDLATGDAEHDCPAAVAAGGSVGFEGEGGFLRVGGFDEDEFVFPDFVEDALLRCEYVNKILRNSKESERKKYRSTHHALPHTNDALHVKITRKEYHHPIRRNLRKLNQQITIIPHDTRIIPNLKSTTNMDLITPPRHDQWQETPAGKGHAIGF